MPLDPRVQRFLKLLAAGQPTDPERITVEARRAGLQALLQMGAAAQAPPMAIETSALPGPGGDIALRSYVPEGLPDPAPALIYFHGGGLIAGSIATHDGIARSLAQAGRCRVLAVDYRLAPEHRFPAGLDDAAAAIRYVGTHSDGLHVDSKRWGVCGDSAGATLAAAAIQVLCAAGDPLPALQLLICPILDYRPMTPSRRELSHGYLLDQATLDHDLEHYLPASADPADPRVSPMRALDLHGTPRTLIHTAEFDPLRDEAGIYLERLTRAGVEVSYTCHPGMIHLFYGLGAVIPYAHQAIEQMGAQIRAAFA